jgi:hypothetical protein
VSDGGVVHRLKYLGLLGILGLLGLWNPALGWLALLSLFILFQYAQPKRKSAEPDAAADRPRD